MCISIIPYEMFDQFLPDLNWLDRKCLCIGVFLQLKYPTRVDSLVLVNPTSTRPGWIEWGYQKVRAYTNNCFTYRRGGEFGMPWKLDQQRITSLGILIEYFDRDILDQL